MTIRVSIGYAQATATGLDMLSIKLNRWSIEIINIKKQFWLMLRYTAIVLRYKFKTSLKSYLNFFNINQHNCRHQSCHGKSSQHHIKMLMANQAW